MDIKVRLTQEQEAQFTAVMEYMRARYPLGEELSISAIARHVLKAGLAALVQEYGLTVPETKTETKAPEPEAGPEAAPAKAQRSSDDAVARIRELAANGMGKADICRTLTEEGYPTARGGQWRISTITHILESTTSRRKRSRKRKG